MARTDSASLVVNAEVQRVFAALLDPEQLREWLPPQGMTGRFESFDPRPGGFYRLVLTYDDPRSSAGKATPDSDIVEARFLDIRADVRVVQAVEFVSDDPAFTGTMTMMWEVAARHDGTQVTIRAEDVPTGITAEDHAAGLASSLAHLAAFVQASEGGHAGSRD